jgi:tetratricopeptide (TPR) repeat protein
VDRTAFNAFKAHDLTPGGVAIAETITQSTGLTKLVRRDISDETIRRIAKQCDKDGLYKDEGVLFKKIKDLPGAITAYAKGGMYFNAYLACTELGGAKAATEYMKKLVAENPYAARGVYKSEGAMFEKMKDLPHAVMAYEKGGLYSDAFAAYLESGQVEAATDYIKKLEAQNPRAALNIYKVDRDTDNIRRVSNAIELKYPLSAAMGYISINEKENALRCADILEAIAQQNPTKKEEIMVDVAYIKLQVGDHKGAADAYEEGGVHQMAEFLKGSRMKEYFSGLQIRSIVSDY